jgi:hypothetical protein
MVRAVVLWSIVGFLPQLALAALPPGEAGAMQAVFDFCSKVDPKERQDFDKQADSLFKGLTPRQIAAIRRSADYTRAYHMLAAVLPDLRDDAVAACQAISGGHEPRHEPRHESGPESRPEPRQGWPERKGESRL